jgi:hypothetical protein
VVESIGLEVLVLEGCPDVGKTTLEKLAPPDGSLTGEERMNLGREFIGVEGRIGEPSVKSKD